MECENLVYNLTKDKDALRDERDQLRINASNLTKAIEVLQSQYNTVSASRDKLQEDVRRLNVSREGRKCSKDILRLRFAAVEIETEEGTLSNNRRLG